MAYESNNITTGQLIDMALNEYFKCILNRNPKIKADRCRELLDEFVGYLAKRNPII